MSKKTVNKQKPLYMSHDNSESSSHNTVFNNLTAQANARMQSQKNLHSKTFSASIGTGYKEQATSLTSCGATHVF